MTAGFQTFNDAGKLQLSSELMQYYLKSKGTVTLSYPVPEGPQGDFGSLPNRGAPAYAYFDFLVGGTAISIDPDNDFVAYSCSSPIFNTALDNTGILYPLSHVNGVQVTYYVFSPFSGYIPASNVGGQIFDAAGGLIFDANGKPMVKVGSYAISSMSPGMDTPLSLPSGRTYAAYFNKPSTRQITAFAGYIGPLGYFNPYNCSEAAFRMSGGDVRITESNKTVYGVGDHFDGLVSVLDVTGY